MIWRMSKAKFGKSLNNKNLKEEHPSSKMHLFKALRREESLAPEINIILNQLIIVSMIMSYKVCD